MSAIALAEQVEKTDPIVHMWLYECGLARRPVDIRLQGASEHDVTVQAERLKRAFGDLLTIERPHMSRKSRSWVAFGKIGE